MKRFQALLPLFSLIMIVVSGSFDASSRHASIADEPAFIDPGAAPIPASPDRKIPDPLSSARAASMTSISVTRAAADLVVSVYLDAPAIHRESTYEQPARLVLDLVGVESRVGFSEQPVQGPNIRRIRTSQFRMSDPAVVRVVFDLDDPKIKNYEIFRESSRIRILFHADAAAPLASSKPENAGSSQRPDNPASPCSEGPECPGSSLQSPSYSREEADAIVHAAEAYRSGGDFTRAISTYERLLYSESERGWIRGRILDLTRDKLMTIKASINGSSGRESLTHTLPEDRIPEGIIWLSVGRRCAVVEKQSQTLMLFRRVEEGLQLERIYPCSTGTRDGAKASQGDERTPEGIYSFGRILPGRELADMYGEMAIPLDYPNAYDMLQGRKGGGIWVHGTNRPLAPYLPRQSRGCIVLDNRDLLELARSVLSCETPVLITQQLRWQPAIRQREQRGELEAFLSQWRGAGEAGSIEAYAGMYSARFRSGAVDLNAWRAHREKSPGEDPGRLRMSLRSIVRCGEYAVLAVDQDYRVSSRGPALKRLFLAREDGVWKILALDWSRARRPTDFAASIPASDHATH